MHINVLDEKQKEVLRAVGPVATNERFVLGGGAAAALHAGHRKTVDLDFFTREKFTNPHALADRLQAEGVRFQVKDMSDGTLHGTVEGMKVSFLRQEGKELSPALEIPGTGAKVASVADVAAQKLLAVANRGDKKDFVDLHVLGERHMPLPKMMDAFGEKFGREGLGQVRRALTYFRDADGQPSPKMLAKHDWDKTKETISRWVGDLDRTQTRLAPPAPERDRDISRGR